MNRIIGYRNMIGLTQKEMAKELSVSEGTYRNKEKGKSSFKDNEMEIFLKLVRREFPSVTIDDIFFY
jgi:DNA-binding XRE family transcriptional regulator